MEASKLRNGSKIMLDGHPWTVVNYTLRPQSRGAAKMITKLKNLINGQIIEKTFPSSEILDDADIALGKAQFLYRQQDEFVFMDSETYEQFEFSAKKLGDQTDYLVEGMGVGIVKWDGNAINIELPPTIVLEVIQTDPGLKGDTAGSANKPATLQTGVVLNVPLFINKGDRVVVNTQTGEYKERARS